MPDAAELSTALPASLEAQCAGGVDECASCPAAEALRHDVASQRFRAAIDATVVAIFLTEGPAMRFVDGVTPYRRTSATFPYPFVGLVMRM